MRRKTTLIALTFCLLIILAACRKGNIEAPTTITTEPTIVTTTETQTTTSYRTTFTTVAPTNVSTIRSGGAPFQTSELKLFFERHQQTMLELAEILIEHDVKSLNISWSSYKGDPIPEELREAFYTFFSIMEAETNAEAQIAVGRPDNKRVVSFTFTPFEGAAIISYMPDGYLEYEHPMPEMNEIVRESEVKLAENWYSVWW